MAFPKKCSVVNGCGEVLSRSAFYRHKISKICQQITEQDGVNGVVNVEKNSEGLQSPVNVKDYYWIQKCFLQGIMLWQNFCGVSDRALQYLITFLRLFIITVADMLQYHVLAQVFRNLPATLYSIRKFLDIDREQFTKYVVCPKCHTLYMFNSVMNMTNPVCKHKPWPKHSIARKRLKCKTKLLDTNNRPKLIYTLASIKSYLKRFALQSNFNDLCNEWRFLRTPEGYLSDIYDGRLWAELKCEQYLNSHYNLAIMINVDWLQPYKHSPYSLGVIYAVFLNLPRRLRFKDRFVMMLGVIPGPSEPQRDINNYLKPIVDELQLLDKGIRIEDGSPFGNTYRVRILGCSSDIPATRKLGGFLGHGATKGCSKCLKEFPRCVSEDGVAQLKADYSGFDQQNWPPRTDHIHLENARKVWSGSTTPTKRNELEKKFGVRWSVLYELTYFRPVTHHTIDPMHCLFLGVAKRFTKMLFKKIFLNHEDAKTMQQLITSMKVPSSVGRIPRKIGSQFASLTADQWKNWVLIYSSVALKDRIPQDVQQMWRTFVGAVAILTKRFLKSSDLEMAEQLIGMFANSVERRFGKEECTPNLHLMCHLPNVMKDYGPVYSFWCFSFERYNGLVADYHLNSHEISSQVMRHFLSSCILQNMPWPSEHLAPINFDKCHTGTLLAHESKIAIDKISRQGITENIHGIALSRSDYVLPDKIKKGFLTTEEQEHLFTLAAMIYGDLLEKVVRCCTIAVEFTYLNEIFQSENFISHSNIVRGRWINELGAVDPKTGIVRAGKVQNIVIVKFKLTNNTMDTQIFLRMKWFSMHPDTYRFGMHTQLYYNNSRSEVVGMFMPIQRIVSKCGVHHLKIHGRHCIVIIPVASSWGLI